jgi:HEAT repeat protein
VAGLEPFAAQPEVAEAVKSAVSDPHPYVRARALLALARGKVPGTREMVLQALKQNSHTDVVRVSAFQAFALMGDKGALTEIIRYLESEPTTRYGREAAVEALGKLGKDDPQALALLERLRKEDFWPGVRRNAAHALQSK